MLKTLSPKAIYDIIDPVQECSNIQEILADTDNQGTDEEGPYLKKVRQIKVQLDRRIKM